MLLDAEPLAQEPDDGLEALIRRELEHALVEVRRGPDGLQPDGDCARVRLDDVAGE
jgi:hypothetical protein